MVPGAYRTVAAGTTGIVEVEWLGRRVAIGRRLRPLVSSVGKLHREAIEDRLAGLAAEVAFFGVLGIFPGLLAVAAALGFMEALLGGDVADRAQMVVTDFLATFLTSRASDTVDAVRSLFDERDATLLSFATGGAVWSVWRAIRAVMRALAVVYDVEEDRPWLRSAMVTLGLTLSTLLVAPLVLMMFVLGPLLGGGEAVADTVGLGEGFVTFWTWVRLPFGFTVLVLWTATVFHLAPHPPAPFRAQLPGALVTAMLWLLLSTGLRFYLEVAGGLNQVLGVIGGFLTVLLRLYLLSLGLLIGGELNANGRPGR